MKIKSYTFRKNLFVKSGLLILFAVLLGSCMTYKKASRFIEQNPEILIDFVDTTTRIEIVREKVLIDTTIYDTIPGETVIRDSLIYIEGDVISGTVRASTDIVDARAWIEDGKLKIEVIQNKQAIAFKIDSAIADIPKVFDTQWLPSEPYLPKSHLFFKYGFFITSGLLLLILALIFLLKR